MKDILDMMEQDGVLDASAKARARRLREEGASLDEALARAAASQKAALRYLAGAFGLPYVEPESAAPDAELLRQFPARLLLKRGLLPLREEDGTVLVATSRVFDTSGLDELRLATGRELRPALATEEEIARYLEFVQFIVSHFKDRVQRYEVWGEPDLGAPGHHIPLLTYIDLVPRLVSVVHTADPEAKIQVGATSGLRDRESQDYLFAVLQSEIMPLVDVVAWHPFYGESPIHEASYYYEYPSIVRQIKRTAEANGFVGEYQADEMVWWTHGEVNDQPWRYSTLQSARYTARTVLLHLGMDVSATLGGIGERPDIFTTIQNLCTTMAGHEAIDMLVEIDINYNGPVAHCSFRFPNGDRMLAVWTDGIAQDEDPGVPATITFPGLTARTVTGIDVLRGFEQDLVFKTDGDSTIVRDLLVKDYPILIKLSDVTMNPDYAETVGDGFHRLGNVNAMPSSTGSSSDRDGDGVPDDEDYCPDWPGSKEANGC